jgi:hypothetical protein
MSILPPVARHPHFGRSPCSVEPPDSSLKWLPPPSERRRARRTEKRHTAAFRPRVEALEAREVPAVNFWMGSAFDTSFDNPSNWSLGSVPVAGDDIVFGSPHEGGSLMDPLGDLPYNCVGMHGDPAGPYNSVTLDATYGGIVILSGGFSTKAFNLEGGTIDQPSGGTDVTVIGNPSITSENENLLGSLPAHFTWVGGTLNSAPNEANVNILSSGSVTLQAGGTLLCGSALYFGSSTGQAVTTTVSGDGTLNFTDGSPITIDANHTLIVATQAGAEAKFSGPEGSYVDGKAKIELKQFGGLTVSGAGAWKAENRKFENHGGTMTIKDGATAVFGSNAAQQPQGPLVTDVKQFAAASARIDIESGSTLKSTWGAVEINGGWLRAEAKVAGGVSTIECKQLNVAGDTHIRIMTNMGKLLVKGGNFAWIGGTFLCKVDCAGNGVADQIQVGEENDRYAMQVGGTATIQLRQINLPAGGLPANFRVEVIKAWAGITGIGLLPPTLALVITEGLPMQLDLVNDQGGSAHYDLIKG